MAFDYEKLGVEVSDLVAKAKVIIDKKHIVETFVRGLGVEELGADGEVVEGYSNITLEGIHNGDIANSDYYRIGASLGNAKSIIVEKDGYYNISATFNFLNNDESFYISVVNKTKFEARDDDEEGLYSTIFSQGYFSSPMSRTGSDYTVWCDAGDEIAYLLVGNIKLVTTYALQSNIQISFLGDK